VQDASLLTFTVWLLRQEIFAPPRTSVLGIFLYATTYRWNRTPEIKPNVVRILKQFLYFGSCHPISVTSHTGPTSQDTNSAKLRFWATQAPKDAQTHYGFRRMLSAQQLRVGIPLCREAPDSTSSTLMASEHTAVLDTRRQIDASGWNVRRKTKVAEIQTSYRRRLGRLFWHKTPTVCRAPHPPHSLVWLDVFSSPGTVYMTHIILCQNICNDNSPHPFPSSCASSGKSRARQNFSNHYSYDQASSKFKTVAPRTQRNGHHMSDTVGSTSLVLIL
jgi:hypothetical protein